MNNLCMLIICLGVLASVVLLILVLVKLHKCCPKEKYSCSGHECDEKYDGCLSTGTTVGQLQGPPPNPCVANKKAASCCSGKCNMAGGIGEIDLICADKDDQYADSCNKYAMCENWSLGIEQPGVWSENYVEFSPDMTHMRGNFAATQMKTPGVY